MWSEPDLPSPTPAESNSSSDAVTLLSGWRFFLLVLATCAFYYAALFISALAVGESTSSLLAPLVAIKRLCVGMGKAVMRTVRRGGGGRGATGDLDDGVEIGDSHDNPYESDELFAGVPNHPSGGVS